MKLFERVKSNSVMDEIRCDETSYLIWKWHPVGTITAENYRENAIRWGSSLRVRDGEAAVFVYNKNGEIYEDYVEGPFDSILHTDNLPILAPIIAKLYAGGTPFPAEIYYINLAQIVQVKFGVPFFDVFDPRFPDFGVPIAVRGTISFHIKDYRKFIKLHRLNTFTPEDFQKQIRSAIARYVKDTVANAPAEHNIPVVQLEAKTATINDTIEYHVGERLKEDFGVVMSAMDIDAIEIDKSSEGYQQLMEVTKDMTSIKVQAETNDYVERLSIQREESQYAQHKQTQSANFAAYQIESQTQIGLAGAEALGKMGENGTGGIDLGGNAGFNPTAIVAGMAVGGAVGQNIAGTINGTMNPIQTAGAVPPPIPTVVYHIAVNGQAAGPYTLNTLQQMTATGQFKADTLVWKSGMTEWVKAETVEELKDLLTNAIPPIPPQI